MAFLIFKMEEIASEIARMTAVNFFM